MNIKELELHANRIRKNILTEVHSANSGHPGGSLSGADILTEIYFEQMDINKENIDLRAVEQIVDNEQLNTIGAFCIK